jgi:hypothetical protein
MAKNPGQDLFCPAGYDNGEGLIPGCSCCSRLMRGRLAVVSCRRSVPWICPHRLLDPTPAPASAPPPVVRCSAGGRVVGRCRGSSFTDGCLIVGRDAPAAAAAGGAAADFAANFACMPPPDATGSGGPVLDKTTRDLLTRLGAGSGAGGSPDRCFNLGAAGGGGGGGAPTLCVQGIGPGGKAECTTARALCFRSSCDAGGKLTVEIAGVGGGAPARLECPTGEAARAAGRGCGGGHVLAWALP